MKTIDLTPTWRTAASIFIEVLENGTEEGKVAAREEILRMADIIDAQNKKARSGPLREAFTRWGELS